MFAEDEPTSYCLKQMEEFIAFHKGEVQRVPWLQAWVESHLKPYYHTVTFCPFTLPTYWTLFPVHTISLRWPLQVAAHILTVWQFYESLGQFQPWDRSVWGHVLTQPYKL